MAPILVHAALPSVQMSQTLL
ncbi:photosystem I assembly protein Ycf3 [Synechococcus sp. RS9916]|nr:photosystem I assembly protein Ycf3 [Synechococcus sp. RS9916]